MEEREPQNMEMEEVCPSMEDTIIPETSPFPISYDLYQEAYQAYQKRFVYPKNRVFQLILLLLAVDFGYHGAKNPDQPLYFFLLLVCLSLIMLLWYNPRKIRRSIMDVVREMEGDLHTFRMDEEKVSFRILPQEEPGEAAEQPPTDLYYTKDLSAIEKEHFFLICQGKQLFYILPKHALYDNQAEIVRETLEEKLGRRFRSKI